MNFDSRRLLEIIQTFLCFRICGDGGPQLLVCRMAINVYWYIATNVIFMADGLDIGFHDA